MSTRPRFSVVVPAPNEADTLPATLASLAAQRCPAPYEVIVVDNASTDATASVAANAGATVVTEPQLGVCRARQAGVAAARGEIVVSTDADTTLPPDWLARIDATNIAFVRDRFPGYDVSLHQGWDEMDLLRTLRRLGPVVRDRELVVETSSRRGREGLPYTVLVSYGYYYVGQRLGRRLLGRSAIPAPAVRTSDRTRSVGRRRRWRVATLSVLGAMTALRIVPRRRRPRSADAGRGLL